jgi:excisionase family DNA binding protein
MIEKHYSVKEVADRLGVSTDTLDRLAKQGAFDFVKLNRRKMISETAIESYIASRTVKARPR